MKEKLMQKEEGKRKEKGVGERKEEKRQVKKVD